jgi:hypothetical protein
MGHDCTTLIDEGRRLLSAFASGLSLRIALLVILASFAALAWLISAAPSFIGLVVTVAIAIGWCVWLERRLAARASAVGPFTDLSHVPDSLMFQLAMASHQAHAAHDRHPTLSALVRSVFSRRRKPAKPAAQENDCHDENCCCMKCFCKREAANGEGCASGCCCCSK